MKPPKEKEIDDGVLEYAARICAAFDRFKKLGGYSAVQIDRLSAVHLAQS
jgi:hypothetical protein